MRWTAFLVAFAVITALISGLRVERGSGRSDVDVRFLANATGQLEVTPGGEVLDRKHLKDGDSARGRLTVENITDTPLAVRLRARSPRRDVDSVLRVRIAGPNGIVFEGRLRGLHRWTKRAVWLRAHQPARLRLTAWLADAMTNGFRGRAADVTLELLARRRG